MTWGRTKHQTRLDLIDLLRGLRASGAAQDDVPILWQKLAGYISQYDPADFVSIGDAAASRGLASLFQLALGCQLDTIQTTAAALTGDANDYDPGPGLFIDLHPTANRTITGLAGGVDGRWHILRNAEQWTLTFPNDSVSSAAANRFFCFTANAKVVLYGGETALVYYYGPNQQWVIWKITGETPPKPFTLGDLHYVNSAPELAILAGNTAATRKFLRQLGTGSVSAAPAWDTLVAGDIPTVLELLRLGIGAPADGTAPLRVLGGEILQETASNGAVWKRGYVTELVTIAAATNTDSSVTLPADSIIEAVVGRVTVQPPGTSTMDVGSASIGATQRFALSVPTTAGTTFVGRRQWRGSVSTDALGPDQTTAQAVRITPDTTPSDATGRVRITAWYRTFTPPTS